MQILVTHLNTALVGIDDTDECAADLNIACDCNGQCKAANPGPAAAGNMKAELELWQLGGQVSGEQPA